MPKNIRIFYNFGFILGITWASQVASGILLASSYTPNWITYYKIIDTMEDIAIAYLVRFIHSNGASLLFTLLFIHTARGLYYKSYKKKTTWYIGSLILLVAIAVSFIGYVLPNNQISYWGCTVITRIMREIPLVGPQVVTLIWGGPEIRQFTINRLFAFHFFLPIASIALILAHIVALHERGSRNPTGITTSRSKSHFLSFSVIKDVSMLIVTAICFIIVVTLKPLMFGDNDNFNMANKIDTPHHIQPEWYFLFAYAILRAIPNKIGGVLALFASVLFVILLPKLGPKKRNVMNSTNKTIIYKLLFWIFAGNFIILTWLGSKPADGPYPPISYVAANIYFCFFLIAPNF